MEQSKMKFMGLLQAIASMHGQKVQDNAMALWFSAIEMAGMTVDQAIVGLNKHTLDPENGRFMPTVAHIVGQVKGSKADIEADALIEFRNMLLGIRKAGVYNDAVFSNHKTNMAIELLGGWQAVCMNEEWSEYIGQKRFIDAYKAASATPVHMRLPLTGIADIRNLYKFGRTPEEKLECDRLLECHGYGAAKALPPIKIKSLDGDSDA